MVFLCPLYSSWFFSTSCQQQHFADTAILHRNLPLTSLFERQPPVDGNDQFPIAYSSGHVQQRRSVRFRKDRYDADRWVARCISRGTKHRGKDATLFHFTQKIFGGLPAHCVCDGIQRWQI